MIARLLSVTCRAGLGLVLAASGARLTAADVPSRAQVEGLIASTTRWIIAQQQPDGALVPGRLFPFGITEMALVALAGQPMALAADEHHMALALTYINRQRQPDGGVYIADEGLGNYTTSLALMVWSATGTGEPAAVKHAQEYLLGIQNTTPGDLGEGGIGYGDKGRGHEDLSNTSYALEALRASGVPAADPHLQAALKFLERCQDLSAVNKQPWVGTAGAVGGGAVYGPADANGSWEKHDPTQAEKFTSSGTMTYSLISSYLTLDLAPEDERVKAALAWVRSAYQFEANPGMTAGKERQGLFHYYTLMARTFARLKLKTFEVPGGRTVDWRADLFAAIVARQQTTTLADGTTGTWWLNDEKRWLEGTAHLTTAYMLRALKAIAASVE
ncbi:MAG: hypothetical protein H0X38_12025 [Planctomycetes bacterium]|nr:hypothetical protein [Planctomycetota bacterium]